MAALRQPTYLRRRLMRLMAEEQQRDLLRQQRLQAQAFIDACLRAQQDAAALAAAADPFKAASDADGQAAVLRAQLH